ncbi:CHAD domain-containing protein [Streptomyces sp. NPDC017179]|uniref:CYTH and CHAD domain-containing protein n=1 Tax=Streptomyces sp. NPDC017179 TaxID=3364979 RepID=UPI0037A83D07
MAQSKRVTEHTYAAPVADDASWLPDLTPVDPGAHLVDGGVRDLDAVYYDTDDLRLTRTRATLRRSTGDTDAGWHLELPLPGDSHEDVEVPLSDEVPDELRDLTLSRTRGDPLRPVARIRTTRSVRHLLSGAGAVVAELNLDTVRAQSLLEQGGNTLWTELDVELAEDGDRVLRDAVEKALRDKGAGRTGTRCEVARALTATGSPADLSPDPRPDPAPGSTGEHVLAYVRGLVTALTDLDPAVRRGRPDAVHRMRVACRRLRGCLRTWRCVLDRSVTDPVRADLRWLGGELGAERDHEVLAERLTAAVGELPGELVLGPVDARLRAWDVARRAQTRRRTLEALASPRYRALLDSLHGLAAEPPLRAKAAAGKPRKVMAKALRKEEGRLHRRMERALSLSPGAERDAAIHHARKAAKRVRYAAEAARPALGKAAGRLRRRAKAVQKAGGDHHDAVVARDALRRLAVAAHAAGEPGFTWGVLHGQERAAAGVREQELSGMWGRPSQPGPRREHGG